MRMKTPNRVIPKSVKMFNKVWAWSKVNKKPFLVLQKKRKYAKLNYDMWTINYNLTEQAVKQLKQLTNEVVKETFEAGRKKSIWFSINEISGYISDILIKVGVEYLPKFEKIIFDEENWISIANGGENESEKIEL